MIKHILTLLIGLLAMTAEAATPNAADLRPYYQDGEVCICVQFASPICHDIVWVGSYNGWSTSSRNLLHFQPLSGFSGWYYVHYTDNSTNIMGKAVQLQDNDTFDWKYQTGPADTWTIVSGSAQLVSNEHNEAQLEHIGKSAPVIAISSAWKNSSCSPSTPAYSGTLPVLHINTENKQPVVSKDYYLTATYYLDNLGLEGYQSIASDSLPDTLQIKGRGNWTWKGFDKKPYRLKLGKKQGPLGLKKNKHFALMAGADDQFSWMKNTLGYMLSRQLGLEWTPGQAPVEVVLNGDYIGLYMLTELIRVDKDRVNIVEQADECTQADSITGGWLVEIDNYAEPYRVEFTEPRNQWHSTQQAMVTPKAPEILSAPQTNYLQSQMNAINTALYANDSSASLVNLIDIEEAAKFYLVQEIMCDCESYHGSCYLHKQIGSNTKWKFGPVWDFGNAFNNQRDRIYDHPEFSQIWIGQLASHPVFQEAVQRLWNHWMYYDKADIEDLLTTFANQIKAAAVTDAKRWPQYNHSDVEGSKKNILKQWNTHLSPLSRDWGQGKPDDPAGLESQKAKVESRKFLRNGQIVIERNNHLFTIDGFLIQ